MRCAGSTGMDKNLVVCSNEIDLGEEETRHKISHHTKNTGHNTQSYTNNEGHITHNEHNTQHTKLHKQ
jgi:hypothetical protein